MRPGQKRARQRWPWSSLFSAFNPAPDIDALLVKLEKQTEEHLGFWSDLQAHLTQEREKRLDDILDALFSARTHQHQLERCSRIVDSEYSATPLSAIGSVLRKPGGLQHLT